MITFEPDTGSKKLLRNPIPNWNQVQKLFIHGATWVQPSNHEWPIVAPVQPLYVSLYCLSDEILFYLF